MYSQYIHNGEGMEKAYIINGDWVKAEICRSPDKQSRTGLKLSQMV